LPDLRGGDLAHIEAVRHVIEDRQMREQRIVLEYESDVAPVGGLRGDILPAEADASGIRHLVARDHPQRGRLAAARRPEERQELAGAHVEHDVAGGVDLTLDAVGITVWRSCRPPRRSIPPS
jgi:hypothetical protein